MRPLLVSFAGGDVGTWEVERMVAVRGADLAPVASVAVLEGWGAEPAARPAWVLRGVTSSERYVERAEQETLRAIQPPPEYEGSHTCLFENVGEVRDHLPSVS